MRLPYKISDTFVRYVGFGLCSLQRGFRCTCVGYDATVPYINFYCNFVGLKNVVRHERDVCVIPRVPEGFFVRRDE